MSLLYLDHFGLNKPPFKITPDLDFFFSGGRRGDILSALLHVALHEEGIITVVAEVGSGKTLLSRLMISRLGPQVSTVYLANPCFSRDEILSAIARDLGLTDLPASTEAKLSVLQQELMRRHALGQRVLLVVDEAHAMPPESIEEVRLLSNLETASHKLVNIMLFGQPELDAVLADPRLRQVRDRVIHRFELLPLPHADACSYIDHRLRAAGWKGGALFSPAALALLVKASGGRARRINLLADKALLGAYASSALTAGVEHVKGALGELHMEQTPLPPTAWLRWLGWSVACVVLAAAMAAAAVWYREQRAPVAPVVVPAVVPAATPAVVPVAPPAATPALVPASAPVVPPPPPQPETPQDVAPPAVVAPVAAAPAAPASAAVPTATGPLLKRHVQRTLEHLATPTLGGYTIQLASLPPDVRVEGYLNSVTHLVDSSMVFAQLSTYNGRNFVSVYYGDFATTAQASAALAGLPASLKTNKPIVRTWARIRQDQIL